MHVWGLTRGGVSSGSGGDLSITLGSEAYTGPAGVVTIGNFDGVHLGHQALLAHAMRLKLGPVVAYTFDPAPQDVLRPGTAPDRLQTLQDRVARLHTLGADHVVVEAFDRGFAAQAAEDFARTVLFERLGARAVVVGWDFRFGQGRKGDLASLTRWLPVPVFGVDAVLADGAVVSSSRVRALVQQGDVEAAHTLLTVPHEIVGTIVHGDARGRTLGFPTANLHSETPLLPAAGVYAIQATSCVGEHRGVANLGVRPTFDGERFKVEVHLFDFDGDLYGTSLRVRFLHHIRAEQGFASVEDLVRQIEQDASVARGLLG